MELKEVTHDYCKCLVSRDGKEVYTQNSDQEFVKKEWHYNADGYPVVSAIGWKDGKKIYRSLQVHILVAKAWLPNPENKPEVNHKDFNRANPSCENLEWATHAENVKYSRANDRYSKLFGEENPNYGNKTLHLRYLEDKDFAKEKQSRPGGRNGKAKPCELYDRDNQLIGAFDYQRAAVYKLIELGFAKESYNLESIIKKLKSPVKYKGFYLILI